MNKTTTTYEGKYLVIFRGGYGFLTALRDWHEDILFAKRYPDMGRALEEKSKLFLGSDSPARVLTVHYKMELEGYD